MYRVDWGYYAQVEEVVCEILNYAGYDAGQDISGYGSCGWLVAFAGKERYNVFLTIPKESSIDDDVLMERLGKLSRNDEMHVVAGVISDEARENLLTLYPGNIVLDLRNLLYLVRGNEKLRSRLVSVLNFSVTGIKPLKPDHRVLIPQILENDPFLEAKIKLQEWDAKSEKNADYEHLCSETLKLIFAQDLTLWREQQTSDGGLFRFDMICKIKRGNDKEFWEMAERYFSSKYIVFEFKNYAGKVTQKEIFTTVKYLYPKALRGIAIIISPNGVDAHADMAIRGILREEGKLIMTLTNWELIQMINMKQAGNSPADYLSDKLDELLIDLEK